MTRRNTRELILATSLSLFNELGEPNVTTNHIADEADISPGNLYYHFRSKADIVIELFKRFLTRFQPLIDIPDGTVMDAEDLWFLLHLTFELKSEFRFLYRNLSDLTARIPDLNRAMRGLLLREREAASRLLAGLERQGRISLNRQEKEMLIDSILLTVTYWIPYADIFDRPGLDQGSAAVKSIARVLQMVTPYLHEPERKRFTSLINDYLATN
jgi:AcrR family transcriptional regulator